MARIKKNPMGVNFEKVYATLKSEKEISPVSLVRAVNSLEKVTAKDKYHVGEVYFNPLRTAWEMWLKEHHPEVKVEIRGKDAFYILPEKKAVAKESKKYFIPTVAATESVEPVKEEPKKKEKEKFPDQETVSKTVAYLSLIDKGQATTETIRAIQTLAGWKNQRYVPGKGVLSNVQEVNALLKELFTGEVVKKNNHRSFRYEFEGDNIKKIIKDCLQLSPLNDAVKALIERKGSVEAKKEEKEDKPETFEEIWKKSYVLRYLRSLSIVEGVKDIEEVDVVTLQKNISNLYKVDLTDEEVLEFLGQIEDVNSLNDKKYERYTLKGECRSFQVRIKRTKEVLQKEYPNLKFILVKQLSPKDSIFEVIVDLGTYKNCESDAAHLLDRLCVADEEAIIEDKSSKWLLNRISHLAEIRFF